MTNVYIWLKIGLCEYINVILGHIKLGNFQSSQKLSASQLWVFRRVCFGKTENRPSAFSHGVTACGIIIIIIIIIALLLHSLLVDWIS